MERRQEHNVHSLAFISAILVVSRAVVTEHLGVQCNDNGAFYCHDTDPGSFTRCIDHELYLFNCPDGLQFNTLSQTCDWPANADCGSHSRGAVEVAGWRINYIMHDAEKRPVEKSGHSEGGVRPWWRPDGVDSRHWEEVEPLVEVPFDGSVSVSASISGKKKASRTWNSSWKEQSSGTAEMKNGESEMESKVDNEQEVKKSAKTEESENIVRRIADIKKENAEINYESIDGDHIVSGEIVKTRLDLDNVLWREGTCNPSECLLPNCRCPGTDIPDGLSPTFTPQMVMITFDDEVSAAYYGYFQRLFRPGRYNPNGCPIRGCLFVSGSGTDYDLVYPMYAMGMEIASHTLSHKFPHTWWASASYQEYVDEVEGMRRKLSSEAGIPYKAIKGFRVPFLQVGADNMYRALYDQKFVYDTSMFTGSVWEGSDPAWPFTLDYTVPDDFCQHTPCPVKQYPGLWEIPVQRWYGVDGLSCAMPDGCSPSADADEDLEFFRSNFKRYYDSNRAPLGIFVHARWFHTEHHLDALDQFIDELMQLDDVYIVTPIQVIEWMRNPTPLDQIKTFKAWGC